MPSLSDHIIDTLMEGFELKFSMTGKYAVVNITHRGSRTYALEGRLKNLPELILLARADLKKRILKDAKIA